MLPTFVDSMERDNVIFKSDFWLLTHMLVLIQRHEDQRWCCHDPGISRVGDLVVSVPTRPSCEAKELVGKLGVSALVSVLTGLSLLKWPSTGLSLVCDRAQLFSLLFL